MRKKRQEFNQAFYTLSDEDHHSPEKIQALFDRFQIDSSKFTPYMEDFRYYVSKKKQRRPEEWAKRETWGFGSSSPESVFRSP